MGSGPSAPLSPVQLDPAFLEKIVLFLHEHDDNELQKKNIENATKTIKGFYCSADCQTNGAKDVNDSNALFVVQVLQLADAISAYSARLEKAATDDALAIQALQTKTNALQKLIDALRAHQGGNKKEIQKQIDDINGNFLENAIQTCKQTIIGATKELTTTKDSLSIKGGASAKDFCVVSVQPGDVQKLAKEKKQCYSSALALPSTAIANAVWQMQKSLNAFATIAATYKAATDNLQTANHAITKLQAQVQQLQGDVTKLDTAGITRLMELITSLSPRLESCRVAVQKTKQQLSEHLKELEAINTKLALHAVVARPDNTAGGLNVPAVTKAVTAAANQPVSKGNPFGSAAIGPIAPPPAAAKSAQDDWRSNDYGFNPFAIKGGCSRRSSPSRSKAARRKSKSRSPRSHRRIGRR